MIATFHDEDTEHVFENIPVKKFRAIHDIAHRRLLRLDAATQLNDLAAIPGNRFKKLAGDRAGQYSIRVNDQYRICFKWNDGKAADVELVDYH